MGVEQIVNVEGALPTRAPFLGFVVLGDDKYPVQGRGYQIVPAGSAEMGALPVPTSPQKYLDVDLTGLFSGDLPDWGKAEGLLKVQVSTRSPQDLTKEATASFITKFVAGDFAYAPTFLYRGVFRNVMIETFANIGLGLIELDTDASVFVDRIKKVMDGVPELKSVDVLKGIPYLEVGTKLVESIIRVFGKNPDDQLWGEVPILEIDPIVGGAFLRSGIYVVLDRQSDNESFPSELTYESNTVQEGGGVSQRTHLIMGVRLREAV